VSTTVSKILGGKADVQPGEPKLRSIHRGSDWKLVEHANNSWRAFVDETVRLEDLEREELWALVASDLHAYDRITVIREDRAFWADCLCVDATPGRARVVILSKLAPLPPHLQSGLSRIPEGYDIQRNEKSGMWVAFRVSDGNPMNGDGNLSQEEALRTLLDHAVFRSR
jgi:hypothetical protein